MAAHSHARQPGRLGAVGRVTRVLLRSKITLLLMLAAALFGALAVAFTPRMYNPEITVPAANVIVAFPGAGAEQVENLVVKPLEALMAALPGVDHTYGYAADDVGVVTVQFEVGQDEQRSLVKLYNQVQRNLDRIPPGVGQPLIKSTGINDVPILTLTLSSGSLDTQGLRAVALRFMEQLRNVPEVGDTQIVGGSPTAVNVWLDPGRLAATGLTLGQVERTLRAANVALPASELVSRNRETQLRVSGVLGSAAEVGGVIVGMPHGKPVFLRDVARIEEGPADPDQVSWFGFGPGAKRAAFAGFAPAVTIAIGKREGANTVTVADSVLRKLAELEAQALPRGVTVTVTRDDGRKADAAVNTLIEHLGIAIVSVAIILLVFLGWREAAIVTVTVPLVLAVVLGIGWAIGQTINRITLFALILSLGLLVDDAIVVIENIHRHLHDRSRLRFADRLVLATDEIGRPTNVATVAVILAFIPMAFVTGMMGPFMRPIPINAPVAMLVSLATAYVVVPWIAWRWLRGKAAAVMREARRPSLEERGARHGDWLRRSYLWAMAPLIDSRSRRNLFFIVVLALLGAAMLQPLWQYVRPQGINGPLSTGGVQLKMLPDDNTNTFLVELDTPAGTPLAATDEVTRRVAGLLAHTRYVTDLQAFVGTPAPPDFAALVRGDTLRSGTNLAQIRVNLAPKEDRRSSSHEIVQRVDRALEPVRAAYPHTRIKLYETPPGPPVRSQMLAELYGPDYARLRRIAGYVRAEFARVYGMINVDDSVTADAPEVRLVVDKDKATLAGLAPAEVARIAHDTLAGFAIGALHRDEAREPRTIVVRLPEARRGVLQQVLDLRLLNREGESVPLGSVVRVESGLASKPIYDKDQHPVVYVSGEMLWSSPVPAVIAMQSALDGKVLPDGTRLAAGNLGFVSKRPDDVSRYQLSWGGEMRLTLDVFRDLGSAFIVALAFIYLLLAAYYESFMMPVVVMGAIPLTLVGVFPGHWLLGQPFTATSMIGVIALAGVVVRNSLLLIDFILAYRAAGHSLRDAVMEAGAVRFRPILLTALAIVSASFIMVSDPVFGGLAISLIFGTVASTALTLLVIPLMYYLWQRRLADSPNSVSPPTRSQGEPA